MATNLDNAIIAAEWMLERAQYHCPEYTPLHDGDCAFHSEMNNHFGYLGSGCYGSVYSTPRAPEYALKISIRDNDSAPAYLAWARAHPQPHVPRVHHLKRKDGYTVAVLDRLDKLDNARLKEYRTYLSVGMDELSGSHPVVAVARQIRKFFDGAASFDLHSDNVMMDADKQLVLTDPLSDSNSDSSRLLRDGIERGLGIADD